MFLLFYGMGRFVVEFFKEYQALAPPPGSGMALTMGQWLSLPLVVVGLVGAMALLWQRRMVGR
jgi:prolipoprotein diacylglyceryltransferase